MFGRSEKNDNDFSLFAIYDTKAQVYRLPIPEKDSAIVVRQIEKLFQDPSQNQNDFVSHAEDFAVYKIGEYNCKTGVISPCRPEHIVNVHELRARAHASMAAQAKVPDLRALSLT